MSSEIQIIVLHTFLKEFKFEFLKNDLNFLSLQLQLLQWFFFHHPAIVEIFCTFVSNKSYRLFTHGDVKRPSIFFCL